MEARCSQTSGHPKEACSAGSLSCSLKGEPPSCPCHPCRTKRRGVGPPFPIPQDPSPGISTSGRLFLTCLHTSSLNLVLLFLFAFKSCPVTSGNSLPFFVLFPEPKLRGAEKKKILVLVNIHEIHAVINLLTNDLITKSHGSYRY